MRCVGGMCGGFMGRTLLDIKGQARYNKRRRRALPVNGSAQRRFRFKYRNRHRAGWRFLRFTMIVTVYGPICSVIRIMPHLLSEELASPPTVMAAHLLSPLAAGQSYYKGWGDTLSTIDGEPGRKQGTQPASPFYTGYTVIYNPIFHHRARQSPRLAGLNLQICQFLSPPLDKPSRAPYNMEVKGANCAEYSK